MTPKSVLVIYWHFKKFKVIYSSKQQTYYHSFWGLGIQVQFI